MKRSILTPQTTDLHIVIPADYIGKKVEVLVFTYDDAVEAPNATPDINAQRCSEKQGRMGKIYLIDSNAAIDFLGNKLPEKGKQLMLKINPEISIVKSIEILTSKY